MCQQALATTLADQHFVRLDKAYWIKSGVSSAPWYLDVFMAQPSQGQKVDVAVRQLTQTWIIEDH